MRQRREIDWETVEALRERGVKWKEIEATLNIPHGTLTAAFSRRREKAGKSETQPSPAPAVAIKEKTLDDFQPREMIRHLYKLGYRIENNGLYVITKQQVKLGDIING